MISVNIELNNPYYDYDAVRDLSMFFGRQNELRMLYSAIEKRQCFSVVGSRHIGKSSLLKYLSHPELRQRYGQEMSDRIFILTDWREYLQKTREDFFRSVCDQIIHQSSPLLMLQSPPANLSGEDRFKRLLEDIRNAGFRPVLLMDAFDKVTKNPHFDPDFFSFLRALAGIYDLISYITASIKPLYDVCHSDAVASSPFFNIFQTCILSSLTIEETRQLITVPVQRIDQQFTPDEVEWIIAQAGRHPFFVQVTCRFLFEEKLRQRAGVVDFALVQEHIYQELGPHFDKAWNDLNEDQQRNLRLEVAQQGLPRRKLAEFSESVLFRKRIREIVQIDAPEITFKDVKEALDNIEDNDFLESCPLGATHYVSLHAVANPGLKKAMHVRDFLKAGFERMRASGVRTDSAPEWRLYNILWFHYFKYHLPNSKTLARLGISSLRQFYREQEKAIQALLNELQELENASMKEA
ncbi:ATP-binding protein [Dictyobacter kobayashii]|uniref:Novel STAND NTPase 2 domain-containing protein n=1 Tax=Dictyobacter kobayashii TaxID=2014872 RepID=A0A402AXY0_9CHLR|nr:ATP-binding protein [Dictyobacter kobayashii]GCE23947.1 hypothetical protein KDK_77470 [Dictyobacter kobayashii]